MAKVKKTSLPDALQWLVESMRLTAFPTPSAKFGEAKWWADLMGAEAEVRNTRPAKGEIIEQGSFDQGTLTLKVTPLRIDWLFISKRDKDPEDDVWPTSGPFPEVGDKFSKLMLAWLSPIVVPPLQRLAFGAVLLQPVKDHEEGYETLAKYLPAVKVSTDSSDFLYQINRPRKSKVPQLTMHSHNRLSKWTCVSLQHAFVQFQGDNSVTLPGEKRHACRLEIDISTPGNFKGELPKDALAHGFHEQFDLAREIASRGDIP